MVRAYTSKKVRLVHKRRKRRFILGLALCSVFILLYAALGFGLTHEKVAITTINVQGNETVIGTDIQKDVWKNLASVRALSLYEGTIFTYNKAAIKSSLLDVYPRLKSVEVHMKNLHTIEVMVAEREAAALWCGERCYLVDEDGFTFEPLSEKPEDLIEYTGDLAVSALRQSLLHGGFATVHDFVTKLENIGVKPLVVNLFEGEAEIQSEAHPVLKIKIDEKLERTLSYIAVTLDSDEYKKQVVGSDENSETDDTPMQYIDVRFGNRVYYK